MPAVTLYVGQHGTTINGERISMGGPRCFSATYVPAHQDADDMTILLDSGAFTDAPGKRRSHAAALERQLRWEAKCSTKWGRAVQADALVSYDLLIDETWVNGQKRKQRWSVADAETAVTVTVAAARYLTERRHDLAPRQLVLSCQGVDAEQYLRCADAVLEYAQPGDWIGLGGWCILGRLQSYLPEYQRTIQRVLPLVAEAGIDRVHIFGVLWEPALAQLLWMADQVGITISTDSTAPLIATMRFRFNPKKAGARHPHWRGNVDWWRTHLANLRSSRWYRELPDDARQLALWTEAA